MNNYFCLIITHGNLGFELYEVAQKFLPINISVQVYSNKKECIENILGKAEAKINEVNPEKIIVFIDLVGGSCWHVAMGLKKNHKNLVIFGGVNLPVLVSLATNVDRLEWDELLDKINDDAVKSIKVLK